MPPDISMLLSPTKSTPSDRLALRRHANKRLRLWKDLHWVVSNMKITAAAPNTNQSELPMWARSRNSIRKAAGFPLELAASLWPPASCELQELDANWSITEAISSTASSPMTTTRSTCCSAVLKLIACASIAGIGAWARGASAPPEDALGTDVSAAGLTLAFSCSAAELPDRPLKLGSHEGNRSLFGCGAS